MINTDPTEERRPEIIIVRRKRGGDDGHHGGAWKIAFADFMTAMMALFLVLWLVNAANEETKKAVASYFNPVKLVDRNRSERGLSVDDGPSKKKQEKLEKLNEGGKDAVTVEEKLETEFRENPQQVLNEIARQARIEEETSALEIQPDNGELRDPFSAALKADTELKLPKPQAKMLSHTYVPDSDLESGKVKADLESEVGNGSMANDGKKMAVTKTTPGETKLESERFATEMLMNSVAEDSGVGFAVMDTVEGTLISITETPTFPLFRSGSSVPEGKLVLLLEKLGTVLIARKGELEIRGHTDATPYRSNSYDNWHLSTDRAHATRLMLLRSGLNGKRIGVIAGFASSRPIAGTKASDPVNRRIEILLRVA